MKWHGKKLKNVICWDVVNKNMEYKRDFPTKREALIYMHDENKIEGGHTARPRIRKYQYEK